MRIGQNRSLVRWIGSIAVVLATLFWLRGSVINFYLIPSASMRPFVSPGDRVAVFRLGYGERDILSGLLGISGEVSKGDVIVFGASGDELYVKRIIAMAGDTVKLEKGRLYVNNVQVERRQMPPHRMATLSGVVEVPQYKEHLASDIAYAVIEELGDQGGWDTTALYVVPHGQVFVMGDNRDNSVDSRVKPVEGPFVTIESIVGKVIWVWPE